MTQLQNAVWCSKNCANLDSDCDGAAGDCFSITCAARQLARVHNTTVAIGCQHIVDIITAYDDKLLTLTNHPYDPQFWSQYTEIFYPMTHDKDESPTAIACKNYLGVFYQYLGLDVIGDGPQYEAPCFPMVNLLPRTYVAIQPRSVGAENPSIDTIQPLVYMLRSFGFQVYGVGRTNTDHSLQAVDWSMLSNSSSNFAAIIQHATLFLGPRSFGSLLASAYRTPSLIWLPDDKENWILNFHGWPSERILYKNGRHALLTGLERLLDSVSIK